MSGGKVLLDSFKEITFYNKKKVFCIIIQFKWSGTELIGQPVSKKAMLTFLLSAQEQGDRENPGVLCPSKASIPETH